MSIPTWSGRNALLMLFIDGKKVDEFLVLDWEITRQGVSSQDAYCGDKRDENDFETTHYNVNFNVRQRRTELLDVLKHQQVLDTRVTPEDSAFAFIIQPNDGTQKAYQAEKFVLDDWNFGAGGKQKNTGKVPGRCRDVVPVPTL